MLKNLNCFVLATVLCASLSVQKALAGGCKLESVEAKEELASRHLSNQVKATLEQMEKKTGKKIKVALISRPSYQTDKFRVIKDNPEIKLNEYLYSLARSVKNEQKKLSEHNRNVDSRDRISSGKDNVMERLGLLTTG